MLLGITLQKCPHYAKLLFMPGTAQQRKFHSPVDLLKCVGGCNTPGVLFLRFVRRMLQTKSGCLHIWECPPLAPCRHAFDEASSHYKIAKPLTLLALTCIPPKDWRKNRYDLVFGHGLSIKRV